MPSPVPGEKASPTPKTPGAPHASNSKRARNGVTKPKAATPSSAPARAKTGNAKKAEPTLLGDFLLGRPSPNRRRRRSLDLVKAEMKVSAVSKLQQPGGVKDRVRQWQKTTAAAMVDDPGGAANDESTSVKLEERERDDGDGKTEKSGKDEMVVEDKKQDSPGREEENPEQPRLGRQKGSGDKDENRARSKSAPRKRVVSDDHWMQKKKSDKAKPDPKLGAGQTLPKNFLKQKPNTVPLEKKIEDWAKRIAEEEAAEGEKEKDKAKAEKERRAKRFSKSPLVDDGVRVYPSRTDSADDGIRIKPSKTGPLSNDDINPKQSKGKIIHDDGIRVTPLVDSPTVEDGMKATTSRQSPLDDGIRVKPILQVRTRATGDQNSDCSTPTKKNSGRRIPQAMSRDAPTSKDEYSDEDTETQRTTSTRRKRKSLADVPVGSSAFSVLDLPVGADAENIRRQKPQRAPSFSVVPKALKRVYTEGMKIMHDTVEPPRGGVNQPPSIESWLAGTMDPFVDRSPVDLLPFEKSESRKRSNKREDEDAVQLPSEVLEGNVRMGKTRDKHTDFPEKMHWKQEPQYIPTSESPRKVSSAARASLPSQTENTPRSPTTLKRTPAKRATSSPKRVPLKEAVAGAFRGESDTRLPKSPPSQLSDSSGRQEPKAHGYTVAKDRVQNTSRGLQELPCRRSHVPDIAGLSGAEEQRPGEHRPLPKRPVPKTGQHRLSTIASVETLTTISSIPETTSEVSQTTITQATSGPGTSYTGTLYTGPTESMLSRQSSNKSGIKRRLTKHSDLMSVLSLPDTAGQGRSKSIRSARSVRTPRNHLATATVDDLLKELAADESKYLRELRTLVDGVIPVLLTSVLSKSDSAVAAGLFDPSLGEKSDAAVTKPIVDMGIALERLRSLHRRIPLQDPKALITWAHNAQRVYEDYCTAWRMGFQDIVVDLAPASPSTAAPNEGVNVPENIPSDIDGDTTDSNRERVDVAFLLRRPLVRIRYLLRFFEVSQHDRDQLRLF
jgi:hypothetical protein